MDEMGTHLKGPEYFRVAKIEVFWLEELLQRYGHRRWMPGSINTWNIMIGEKISSEGQLRSRNLQEFANVSFKPSPTSIKHTETNENHTSHWSR